MDRDTASYIRKYFSRLMTDDEKLALNYHMYNNKTADKDGYEAFELSVASRIMKEKPEKVFLNNCPNCNKLARTPYARQCRYCSHNWHDLTVAQFELTSAFQITGRCLFLLGNIIKGEFKKGQFIDLTILGLNYRPEIEAIEFARRREGDRVWEEIGLGITGLTEEDKAYLKNLGSFGTPIDIIRER